MSVYLTRYAVLVILEETEFTDLSENGEKLMDGRSHGEVVTHAKIDSYRPIIVLPDNLRAATSHLRNG